MSRTAGRERRVSAWKQVNGGQETTKSGIKPVEPHPLLVTVFDHLAHILITWSETICDLLCPGVSALRSIWKTQFISDLSEEF